METKIIYRLECKKHWWNFPSFEEAQKAAESYSKCENGFSIHKLVEIVDDCGNIQIVEQKEIQ